MPFFRLAGDVTDDAWKAAMRVLHTGGKGVPGLTWRSLQHATTTLRHLLDYCRQMGAIAGVPKIHAPKNKLVAKEQAPRRALTEKERDRVLLELRRVGADRQARIWTVMAYAGLRRTETAKLTLRWMDARAGIIQVPATASKSGEEEQVPLHAKVRQAIRAEAAANEVKDNDTPVFGGFDMRKSFAAALIRAKVDKHGLTPHHSARHTFGTLLAQYSRGDVTAVQAGGRWRSLAMVQRYVHANAARARAAVRRL